MFFDTVIVLKNVLYFNRGSRTYVVILQIKMKWQTATLSLSLLCAYFRSMSTMCTPQPQQFAARQTRDEN